MTRPDQTTPLTAGGRNDLFAVVAPPGARCPGDSQHDQWYVYSFLVPDGSNPSSISFAHVYPSKGYGLYDTSQYVGPLTTAPSTGELPQLPHDLVWSRLTANDLLGPTAASATWDAGLACNSPDNQVGPTWDVRVAFHRADAAAGGYTWSIPHDPAAPGSDRTGLEIAVLVVAALAAAGVWYLTRSGPSRLRRRRRRSGPTPHPRPTASPDSPKERSR